jgi:hypothetical protein
MPVNHGKAPDVVRCFGIHREGQSVGEEPHRLEEPSMAESQLSELQNLRVLLEEATLLTRDLAYHRSRRAKLEARLELVLYETDRQIEDLRANRG